MLEDVSIVLQLLDVVPVPLLGDVLGACSNQRKLLFNSLARFAFTRTACLCSDMSRSQALDLRYCRFGGTGSARKGAFGRTGMFPVKACNASGASNHSGNSESTTAPCSASEHIANNTLVAFLSGGSDSARRAPINKKECPPELAHACEEH